MSTAANPASRKEPIRPHLSAPATQQGGPGVLGAIGGAMTGMAENINEKGLAMKFSITIKAVEKGVSLGIRTAIQTDPWIWPSTVSGLSALPQSCATQTLSTVMSAVSGSTVTSTTWAA